MKTLYEKIALGWLIVTLVACSTYQADNLPTAPDLASSVSQIDNAGRLQAAADEPRPLDRHGIALLALANNPDLKAARLELGIVQARRFQAGLLPDPQFTGALGLLIGGPGTANAYTVGLSEDVRALILRPAEIDAAEAAFHQTEWSIVWQEWQTASKAELFYIDMIEQQKLRAIFQRNHNLFAHRLEADRLAQARGDVTLVQTAPEAASLSDLTKQLDDLQQQQVTREHDFRALLGLTPQAALPLETKVEIEPLATADIDAALATLPQRRPDLLALRAGYDAQEAKTRASILGQFPAMVLGGAYGSDTTSVLSAGPQVAMDIPVFNRNQGNVRIEQATREKLKAEYTARIDAAYSEAHAMAATIALLERQRQVALAELPQLQAERDNAQAAFTDGDLDVRSYSDIVAAATTREAEAITLEQALLEDRLALYVLLGSPPPQSQEDADL